MDKFHERQVVYDGEKIHALGRTISYLKDNVIGFFVAAPLNWGHDARVDSDVAKKAWVGVDLAENSSKESGEADRKSTRLNSSHIPLSRMPSSA